MGHSDSLRSVDFIDFMDSMSHRVIESLPHGFHELYEFRRFHATYKFQIKMSRLVMDVIAWEGRLERTTHGWTIYRTGSQEIRP